MLKKAEPYWPLILLLALIKFVLPIFLQSPVYELQRDEYLYYEQGQHLALGYLENPPLLSYLGTISSWFGGSPAWIKFWPCLFGAATVVLTCLITAELGGNRFAQFLSGLGLIISAYLRLHFLYQPNVLDIFFWTLAVYFLIRYIHTKNPAFIYWIAISIGLGWWSKYSIMFMAAAIVISLLLTRHRVIFLIKQTWLAVALAGLMILPNMWWQYQHNWPLVHHMEELRQTQLRFVNPADFIKDQLLMLVPVSFVWIAGLIWLLKHSSFRIIGFIYLSVIILLILGSGKSYYALGAYPILLAAGSVAWENISRRRIWIRPVITGIALLLFIPFIPVLLPVWKPERLETFYKEKGIDKIGVLKWEDQKDHALPQDFADMLGWKELAEKTEKFFHTLPAGTQSKTIIFCDSYGQAGALKYYGIDDQFKSKVISTNGSFVLWIPGASNFNNLLIVTEEMPGDDEEIFRHFQKTSMIDSVTNIYSRQMGNKIIFFENIDSTGSELAKEALKNAVQPFTR